MKKILSFLTKKPLALAAVALFSMSSYAQTAAEGDKTPEVEPISIWQKVSETNPLFYFDMVTVVDEAENKVYADDGTQQINAKDFLQKDDDGNFIPGTTIPEGASFFYVAEGIDADYFSLNKTLATNKDGKYINAAGEEVSAEDVAAGKEGAGAAGAGIFLMENASLSVSGFTVSPEVSWDWDEMEGDAALYRLIPGSNIARYVYYNKGAKQFYWTVGSETLEPAKLYKAVQKLPPYFEKPTGVYTNEDDFTVVIVNPNPDGTLKWRKSGDEEWQDYTDPIPVTEKDEEITFETYIEFEGGSTGSYEATYLLTDIEAPEIEPETGFDVNDKGEIDDVTITSEDGTTLAYEITGEDGTTSRTEPSNEATENLIDYIGQTVTVTATAHKTVTFKGKEEPVESDPTTREYIITPYPAPDGVVFMAYPAPESTVDLGTNIDLWFEVGQEGYGVEYDGTKDANKKLTLTFKDGEEVEVDVKEGEDGKVYITVPSDKKYANSEFTFDVPEGFYYTYTGGEEVKANQVPTPEQKDVKYYTGQFASTWVIDCDEESGKPIDPNKYLTTDDNTALFQVYPSEVGPDAEVDFADPESNDPTHGAKFTQEVNGEITPIESVEKVEGSKNMFKVTFYNPEGKAEYIEKYLQDDLLTQNGYHLGFPEKTFVSGDYTNGPNLSANIYFTEAVDLVVEPIKETACEGGYYFYVKVTATGKVLGTNYNTAYDSDEDSKIVLDSEKEVTISGTTIYGDEEEGTATIKQADPANVSDAAALKKVGTKEVYRIQYPGFKGREEDPMRDADRYLREDGGEPYVVTLPEGTFTINMSAIPESTCKLDVTAHPHWAATARPYTYDEGKTSASTITLDCTATLDDFEKLFEYDVTSYDATPDPAKITLSRGEKTIAVKSWTLTEVSVPYNTTFAWKESYGKDSVHEKYDAVGMEGSEVVEESFVVTLTLEEPIDDVEVYDIVISDNAFTANRCPNQEIRLKVYPKVNYFIQKKYYSISTNVKSIEYYIAGILPDGSPLDKEIKYVGATEDQTTLNALAYNDALNENGTLKQEGSKYPEVTATELGTSDAEFTGLKQEDLAEEWQGKAIPATKFTLTFPEGTLVPNNYKMNFAGINPEGPAGTVQAEGYNANEWDLYNNFQVVPALAFDATSSYEDYQQPAKEDKKKEYNISTKTESITLYLTALNLYNNSNANKSIDLDDEYKDKLLIDGKEGVVTCEKDGEGYTVTFVDGGLAVGQYILTVPAGSVVNNTVYSGTSPQIDVRNPEKFDLIINVEDFAGPADQPIEITTKTWEFDVPLSEGKVTEVNEDAEVWLVDDNGNGMPVELSKTDETTLHVTLTYDEEEEHYNFLHSTPFPPKSYVKGAGADADADAEEKGLYTLVIPAEAFTGEYATTYEDLTVKVKVIYEFVDSNTGVKDGEDNDLVTTEMEVGMETGEHEKIYFTRKFANDRFQGFAVPFDVKQADVADYFTIYRIQTVTVEEGANGKDVFKLNFVPVGEEGKAFANKPYIIKAKQTSNDTVRIALDKAVTYVEYPEVAPDIKASTTLMRFDFKNTIKEQDGSKDLLTIGWDAEYNKPNVGNTEGVTIPAWRWFMETSAKSDEPFYIKIAINGVDVDATGIDFVDAAEGDNLIFNVAGQKLNTAAKGKVNIINGKKVLVK